jgi:hypothetical protein
MIVFEWLMAHFDLVVVAVTVLLNLFLLASWAIRTLRGDRAAALTKWLKLLEAARELEMEAEGFPIKERYADCGRMIYDRKAQDVHCGGSGCGCAAVVLGAHLVPSMLRGELGRILFLATGAMMSPDSIKQGQNIPAIAHLLELEVCERREK